MEIKNTNNNITKIFAKTFEYLAFEQVRQLCNYEPYLDSKIRIMPDAHAGKGCTIGTTMTIKDKVTPNLVGVDIGCGMLCVRLGKIDMDLQVLDKTINESIPSGPNIRNTSICNFNELNDLKCIKEINLERAIHSIGTLGGGNHFIEVDISNDGFKYLLIHSGSRNLGVQVCNYYQNKAYCAQNEVGVKIKEIIDQLKKEGRHNEIESTIRNFRKPQCNKELAFLEGKDFQDYLHDMVIVQRYASLNRKKIADLILKNIGVVAISSFETVHNYIDVENMILRKGAVSAKQGEEIVIPINMRDGSLICVGRGNEDWNYSAPHGAGRLMSRSVAKRDISLEEFQKSMDGIYSTSVVKDTLDEAPQAYKSIDEIIECIEDTVFVTNEIKPIYNFKAH